MAELLGKDQMMDPVIVLDLPSRDNADLLHIFKERFPFLLPSRVHGVTGAKYMQAFDFRRDKKFFRTHRAGDCHRKRRMDMQIGICKHDFLPDYAVQIYKRDALPGSRNFPAPEVPYNQRYSFRFLGTGVSFFQSRISRDRSK